MGTYTCIVVWLSRSMSTTNKEEDLRKLQKEIWEKAVETQMHFNEMSVKSRQLGLTFVVAALGLCAVLLTRNESIISVPLKLFDIEIKVHAAVFIVLVAAGGLYAVRRLDLGVYHQMLRGAVKFGEELERSSLRDQVMGTPLGMTEFITLYSRNETVTKEEDGVYRGKDEKPAADKIARFYTLTTLALIVIAVAIGCIFFEKKDLSSSKQKALPSTGQQLETPPGK
jgi:hypothetical protein